MAKSTYFVESRSAPLSRRLIDTDIDRYILSEHSVVERYRRCDFISKPPPSSTMDHHRELLWRRGVGTGRRSIITSYSFDFFDKVLLFGQPQSRIPKPILRSTVELVSGRGIICFRLSYDWLEELFQQLSIGEFPYRYRRTKHKDKMHVLETTVFWSIFGMFRMLREDSFRQDRWHTSVPIERGVHVIPGSQLTEEDLLPFHRWNVPSTPVICVP